MATEFLCTEDACVYLNLKKNSFYNCINRGELVPANPTEKPYMFAKNELDRWKDNRDRKKNLKKRYRIADRKMLLPYKIIQLG